MKQLNASPIKAVFATMLTICLMSVSASAGIDSYEVYLNNKLIIRQSMAEPLDLKTLPISAANIADKIVIRYRQCNAPNQTGKNRSISVVDADGKLIKQWKFKDAEGSSTAMEIPVRDLLALRERNQKLNLCYNADGMEKMQQLVILARTGKTNG